MVFGNGVKNIQAAAYNGARTVYDRGYYQIKKTTEGMLGGKFLLW